MSVDLYLRKYEALKAERSTTESEWQNVADYMFPRRDFTTTRTAGSNRRKQIYDSTGLNSVMLLAAALHGYLTPMGAQWFSLTLAGKVHSYLDDARSLMMNVFSDPETGFSSQIHELYLDLVAFGTAVMRITRRNGRYHFYTLNLADCYIDINQDGVIDTLLHVQEYTAVQMVDEFGGDNVHKYVIDALVNNPDKKFKVLNIVKPRKNHAGRGALKKSKPFESAYIDVQNKHIMKEDGYDDFPFVVTRSAKRSGEKYGYGHGMAAFSDVRMLNTIVEVMIRAATKNADPPVLSPIDGVILPMRLDPAGISYYNPDVGPPEFWSNNFRPDYMESLIRSKQESVQKVFYIDWLNLPNNDRMTATEIMQRTQDSFKNMSALNARIEAEGLSRIVNRLFMLMLDSGDLPKLPTELQGKDMKIVYTSPMAQAQKAINANSTLQALSMVAQLGAFDPNIAALPDVEAIARDQLINTYFLPTSYIRNKTQYKQIVQQNQEAATSAQMAQNAQAYSQAGKNAADAVSTMGGM